MCEAVCGCGSVCGCASVCVCEGVYVCVGGGGWRGAQDHTDLQKAGLRLPPGPDARGGAGAEPAAAGLTYERELVHGDALRPEVLLDAGQPLHVGAPAPAQLVDVLDLRLTISSPSTMCVN